MGTTPAKVRVVVPTKPLHRGPPLFTRVTTATAQLRDGVAVAVRGPSKSDLD